MPVTDNMFALKLPAEVESLLDSLAQTTGRTKSFHAREAIVKHLNSMEEARPSGKTLGIEAVRGIIKTHVHLTLEEIDEAIEQGYVTHGMKALE